MRAIAAEVEAFDGEHAGHADEKRGLVNGTFRGDWFTPVQVAFQLLKGAFETAALIEVGASGFPERSTKLFEKAQGDRRIDAEALYERNFHG